MKSYHEPIDVALGDDGLPRTWRWRKSVWQVLRVLDRWVLQSRWWTSACSSEPNRESDRESSGKSGAEKRDYLLVEAVPEARADPTHSCAVEIYLRGDGDVWILARILH
jgi:hypothetical protein